MQDPIEILSKTVHLDLIRNFEVGNFHLYLHLFHQFIWNVTVMDSIKASTFENAVNDFYSAADLGTPSKLTNSTLLAQ